MYRRLTARPIGTLRISLAVLATVLTTFGGLVATGSAGSAATPAPRPPDARVGGAAQRSPAVRPAYDSRYGVAFQNFKTDGCIDDSPEYGLRTFGCNYASFFNGYQQWKGDANHPYQLRNVKTLQCLDDSPEYGLRMFGCNDDSYTNGYQFWYQLDGYPGQLVNQKTGRCLDDSQVGLRTFGCNYASYRDGYQHWYVFQWSTP